MTSSKLDVGVRFVNGLNEPLSLAWLKPSGAIKHMAHLPPKHRVTIRSKTGDTFVALAAAAAGEQGAEVFRRTLSAAPTQHVLIDRKQAAPKGPTTHEQEAAAALAKRKLDTPQPVRVRFKNDLRRPLALLWHRPLADGLVLVAQHMATIQPGRLFLMRSYVGHAFSAWDGDTQLQAWTLGPARAAQYNASSAHPVEAAKPPAPAKPAEAAPVKARTKRSAALWRRDRDEHEQGGQEQAEEEAQAARRVRVAAGVRAVASGRRATESYAEVVRRTMAKRRRAVLGAVREDDGDGGSSSAGRVGMVGYAASGLGRERAAREQERARAVSAAREAREEAVCAAREARERLEQRLDSVSAGYSRLENLLRRRAAQPERTLDAFGAHARARADTKARVAPPLWAPPVAVDGARSNSHTHAAHEGMGAGGWRAYAAGRVSA